MSQPSFPSEDFTAWNHDDRKVSFWKYLDFEESMIGMSIHCFTQATCNKICLYKNDFCHVKIIFNHVFTMTHSAVYQKWILLSRNRFWGPNVPFSFYSLHSEICMMGEAWCIQSYQLLGSRGHGFILRPICPSPQILNWHDQKSDWPRCAVANGFDQSKHDFEVAIVHTMPKTILRNRKSL